MAVRGPFKVEFDDVFPLGAGVVGAVGPKSDFKASTAQNQVQERDKETGVPMWVVDVMDFDPEARERTFRVNITSPVQPVPPETVAGLPVRPVVLEGLTVSPYLQKLGERSKIVFSLRATGLSAPRGARGQGGEQGKAA